MPEWRTPFEEIEVGKGRMIRDGEEVAILTIGHIGNYAVEACKILDQQNMHSAHFDLRFVKPLDKDLLEDVFLRFRNIITVEDAALMGGFGSAVLEFMADNGLNAHLKRLGIPDTVVEHGSQLELHKESGFDPAGIVEAVLHIATPYFAPGSSPYSCWPQTGG